ncbi:hypothetical protein EJ04DRAFT_230985 [Polyplosphaeria fusca]|uniref:Uncharacterized protein n=1 Tax=Polyplosphaeria fusca TaxID=682080 RepID=A0A9P4V3T3_9PLEO|nr:hypothetical protein EJ04DRAFT_230985 [Polyplosphaeria fusca]
MAPRTPYAFLAVEPINCTGLVSAVTEAVALAVAVAFPGGPATRNQFAAIGPSNYEPADGSGRMHCMMDALLYPWRGRWSYSARMKIYNHRDTLWEYRGLGQAQGKSWKGAWRPERSMCHSRA